MLIGSCWILRQPFPLAVWLLWQWLADTLQEALPSQFIQCSIPIWGRQVAMMGRVLGPAKSGFEPLLLSLLAGGPSPYPNSRICNAYLIGMLGRLTKTVDENHLAQRRLHKCQCSISLKLMFWRRKWQPTLVFLPGKSHGWRSLVGCSPWGHKESDMTERLDLTYFTSHA